jgi:peptidoglycan/LPS O-acetylase OafA/YrhL
VNDRIAALDGVRGLAILVVLFHHAVVFCGLAPSSGAERLVDAVAHQGWMGVDLFFTLSGFLITGILLRTKGRDGYFRNFLMRRVLRIFPLYYFFILVFFVILPRVFPAQPELARLPAQQAWYWLYLPNVRIYLNGDWYATFVEHAWSLSIEEQFYLVWPIVVALLSRRNLVRLCLVAIPLSLALRVFIVRQGGDHAAAFVLTPAHLDGLLLGAMLAAFEPRVGADRERSRPLFVGLTVAGIAFVALVPRLGVSYALAHYALSVTGWSVACVGFVGIAITSPPSSLVMRVLTARPLAVIGTYSYGVYLVHQPLMRALVPRLNAMTGSALRHWAVLGLVGGVLSLGIAWLTYHAFERRFLSLKRYFEPATASPGRT